MLRVLSVSSATPPGKEVMEVSVVEDTVAAKMEALEEEEAIPVEDSVVEVASAAAEEVETVARATGTAHLAAPWCLPPSRTASGAERLAQTAVEVAVSAEAVSVVAMLTAAEVAASEALEEAEAGAETVVQETGIAPTAVPSCSLLSRTASGAKPHGLTALVAATAVATAVATVALEEEATHNKVVASAEVASAVAATAALETGTARAASR